VSQEAYDFQLKMHHKAFGSRTPPKPAGGLAALQDPLDRFRERKGRGWMEGKGHPTFANRSPPLVESSILAFSFVVRDYIATKTPVERL